MSKPIIRDKIVDAEAIRFWADANGMMKENKIAEYPFQPSVQYIADDLNKPKIQIMFNTYYQKSIYDYPLVPGGVYYVYPSETEKNLYFGTGVKDFKLGTCMEMDVWQDTRTKEIISVTRFEKLLPDKELKPEEDAEQQQSGILDRLTSGAKNYFTRTHSTGVRERPVETKKNTLFSDDDDDDDEEDAGQQQSGFFSGAANFTSRIGPYFRRKSSKKKTEPKSNGIFSDSEDDEDEPRGGKRKTRRKTKHTKGKKTKSKHTKRKHTKRKHTKAKHTKAKHTKGKHTKRKHTSKKSHRK